MPRSTLQTENAIQLLQNPIPIDTAPQENAIPDSQFAAPTFLINILLGRSKIMYPMKNTNTGSVSMHTFIPVL
jgi:hypothetical protein